MNLLGNIIWVIFGGVFIFFEYIIGGLILCLTIVGIPSNYSYRFNPQIAQGFPRSSHIVNIAFSLLTQKKDRGQFKLSIYDLLNQNISVGRYGNLNALVTNEQLILKRYVMLNYQYKFNVMKTK